MNIYHIPLRAGVVIMTTAILISSCATQQGYQGAGVGALTGATAGVLLDPDNRWRGAVIGGGMGALLGGTLTDIPRQYYPHEPSYYEEPYYYPNEYYPPDRYYPSDEYYQQRGYYPSYSSCCPSPSPRYAAPPDQVGRGAVVGGLTGAAAGALLDHGNAWRGGVIGGALGTFFGWGIGTINSDSGPSIPMLRP